MRQFLVSTGRLFSNRGVFALRKGGMDPTRGVTQSSTKDHPIPAPKMSGWEQTKDKITSNVADRQAAQHQRMEGALGDSNSKTSSQNDMNAGIGSNQTDANAKKWTETSKDQTHDFSSDKSKGSNQEQLLRDAASGKSNKSSGGSKDQQDLAEKQKNADQRAAKYPNMPKGEFKQNAGEPEHKETDKITSVINEEHGLPEVGGKKNNSPQTTGLHEQHGARLGADDMVRDHQPKMRFDPARSAADNANTSAEQQGKNSANFSIKSTADHQKKDKADRGIVDSATDSIKEQANASAGWLKENFGSDAKRTKTEGKETANAAERNVAPTMRGEFGIPSGSPVGAIKNPEKRPKADQTEKKH